MAVRDGAPEAPRLLPPVVAGFPRRDRPRRPRHGSSDGGGGGNARRGSTFGVPDYVPFSTAPMTVSREVGRRPRPGGRAPAAPRRTPRRCGARHPRAPAAAAPRRRRPGGGDPDKVFEDLYDRLKRELLLEQEQLGQAFHEP